METNIKIDVCGSHSITGAIQVHVNEKSLSPSKIIIDIDELLYGVNIEQELANARRTFAKRPYKIEIGEIVRDCNKEVAAIKKKHQT